MKITLEDRRDEYLNFLGFITAEEGEAYLHASVSIYKDKHTGDESIWFENFMHGHIGKYRFQADRYLEKACGGNGGLFMGVGRGKKPDKAYEDMREFIHKVANMEYTIGDMNLVKETTYSKQYEMEV